MLDQILNLPISVFIPIKEYVQHMVQFQMDQVYAEYVNKMII